MPVDIDEIQHTDPEIIASRKALDSFVHIKKPLFVTDTYWNIPALRGFPGAYMKEVNDWLTPDDFLRLLDGKKDRSVLVTDCIAFTDGNTTSVYKIELRGFIAHERYKTAGDSVNNLLQFDGKYLQEYYDSGEQITSEDAQWRGFIESLDKQ